MNIDIQKRIWDYLDGFLPENERRETEKLIEENEAFKRAFMEISQIQQSLTDFQTILPSPELAKKILRDFRSRNLYIKPYDTSLNKKLLRMIAVFLIAVPIIVLAIHSIENGIFFKIDIDWRSVPETIFVSPLIWALILCNFIFAARFIQRKSWLNRKYSL